MRGKENTCKNIFFCCFKVWRATMKTMILSSSDPPWLVWLRDICESYDTFSCRCSKIVEKVVISKKMTLWLTVVHLGLKGNYCSCYRYCIMSSSHGGIISSMVLALVKLIHTNTPISASIKYLGELWSTFLSNKCDYKFIICNQRLHLKALENPTWNFEMPRLLMRLLV